MNKRRIIAASGIVLFVLLLTIALLVWFGVIQLNGCAAKQFAVRGVDVSAYQGEIQWNTFAAQDIQFAFIKATEGSGFVDEKFQQNWERAEETDLRIGAYHFFSFDSCGETQAENFTATVTPIENMLPPVVDVEYYGDYKKNPPEKEAVQQELSTMLKVLEETYGIKPILYITQDTSWLKNTFPEYDYWVRDVYTASPLDSTDWTFWQYTNREVLDGYDGEERYIDCNVFVGSEEAFEAFGKTD